MRPRLARRFPALTSRDFRLFWSGQFVSRAGTNMQNTALNWHLYTLTHSPLALGMLGLVRFVPVIILSLLGGTLADAVNRRRLMLVTQTIVMINAGVLGWLTTQGQVSATAIYVITAISAGAMAFDSPARQALVPNLVPREHLVNAVSLNSAVGKIASIMGPLLAGVLIDAGGIRFTYWLNAASFLAVLWALLAMKSDGGTGEVSRVSLSSLREGLDFVARTPIVLGTMVLDAVATFFSSATALLPIFATDILHVGARGYGILSAAPAVGSLVAAAAFSLLPRIERQGRALLWAVTIHGAATLGFGFSRWFWVSCLLLAVADAGDTVSTILRQTIRQLVTPDRLRGRVGAVNMIFFMGGPRLGEMEAGLVAAWVSAPASVAIGGVGCMLTALLVGRLLPAVGRYKGD